jgi:DNA polymerase-3 subunit gamma/tau
MALIRLSYAADLPPTDKLVRDLLDNPPSKKPSLSPSGGEGRGEGAPPRATLSSAPIASVQRAQAAPEPTMSAAPAVQLRSLEDIVALLETTSSLKVNLEHNVHLVRMVQGRIEIRTTPRAPTTLASDLSQKLLSLTGQRWSVSIVREGGGPTLAEQKKVAKAAKFESATQEPLVRAVLDRFPGAEIKEVRRIADDDIAVAMPDDES